MATKLYLHDALASGTLPGASSVTAGAAPTASATGASTNRTMTEAIGSAQVGSPALTVPASGTGWFRRFVSDALAAQTVSTGTWSIHAAALQGGGSGALSVWTAVLVSWRPSTSSVITRLFDQSSPSSFVVSSEASYSENPTGLAVTFADGDRLVLELWATEVDGLASATLTQAFYDGTTEDSASSNAAYLLAPVTLTFSSGGAGPTGPPYKPQRMPMGV